MIIRNEMELYRIRNYIGNNPVNWSIGFPRRCTIFRATLRIGVKMLVVQSEDKEKMSEINKRIEAVIKFRNERDWKQFHKSKDLADAISIEASELLELFLWKESEKFDREMLKGELADILIYCLLLSDKHNLDIGEIIQNKISKNEKKYPVDKSHGKTEKYNRL